MAVYTKVSKIELNNFFKNYEIGKITKNLSLKRQNNLSINSWPKLFGKVEKDCSKIHKNLSKIIKISLEEIKKTGQKNYLRE